MMKLNLIAGLVCVALLSACSSQKIAAGETVQASPASTGITASEPSGNADERAENNNKMPNKNTIQSGEIQQLSRPTMVK